MSYTHAVVVGVPNSLKFANKKSTLNTDALRKQSEGLMETLREAGVVVSEYYPKDGCCVSNLLVGDAAVSLHGTVLFCRPKKPGISYKELRRILPSCCRTIQECPETVDGKTVVLEGGDVFSSGKEIFVGVRSNGTNFEGVKVVARIFCDHAVIPVQMSDKAQCLRYYVSLVAPGVIAIGTSKEAQNILKVLEAEATLRYKIISVEDEDGVNSISVNNRLIFQQNRVAALARLGTPKRRNKASKIWAKVADVLLLAKGSIAAKMKHTDTILNQSNGILFIGLCVNSGNASSRLFFELLAALIMKFDYYPYRKRIAPMKLTPLQSNGLELWTVDVSDLLKAGAPLARHCLLIKEIKSPKDFFS